MFDFANKTIGTAGSLVNNAVSKTTGAVSSIFKAPFAKDKQQLSPAAQMLGSLSSTQQETLISEGKPVNIAKLRQVLQENAASLKELLEKIRAKNNIDSDLVFQMNVDSSGNIVINSQHPQKLKMQQLLNSDPTFKQLFKDSKSISDFIMAYDKAQSKAVS